MLSLDVLVAALKVEVILMMLHKRPEDKWFCNLVEYKQCISINKT